MELALWREHFQFSDRAFLFILLSIWLVLLAPSIITLASAVASQPTIGRVGAGNSSLTVGMHPMDDSTRLVDFTGLSPSTPAPATDLGNIMLKQLIRICIVAGIMITIVKKSVRRGGSSLLVDVFVGLVAFVIIDRLIEIIL